MSKRILIVEDEKNIVDILSFNLSKEGYETLEAYDGQTGLQLALEQNPDLILLDLMLPKMDGFDVCRNLRKENRSTPVIMLTAREEETDKVLGLELGADDYITKPFSMRELLARVKANIRRNEMVAGAAPAAPSDSRMELGRIAIDPDQLAAVFGDGTKVSVFTGEADGTVMQFRRTDRIEAATPCLIMPAQTTADPTFTGVTLAATEAKSISTADGSYKFTGTYSPKTLATDGTDLFITQDGSLKKPSGTTGNANLMKGMRAYITIPGGASATAVRLNISPTPTAMRAAATDGSHSPSTFNLAGQKVDAPGKGIYIRNGKKFIMK